jgi:hypothetical protein
MDKNRPSLSFAGGFTKQDEFLTPLKGYRNDGIVELPDNRRFSVCFYDAVRLAQDISEEKIIAEIGLIVLEEVTRESMEDAVLKLWKLNYFDHLKPI